jgi:salicylate hydroxylase
MAFARYETFPRSTCPEDLLLPKFIRRCSLPDYSLRYNGQTVYRTIISKAEALKINGIPQAPVFWKHVSGLYVYTCPLGNDEFEVTVRIRRSNPEHGQVSWGRSFDLDILLHQFSDFCLPVRQALDLAAAAETQEFALLSGPRLESMVFHDNVAFIGDAAHALCGNFGAGAGFALEDVYTLARSLEWIYKRDRPLKDALELYDSIRSPHYHRLYELITKFAKIKAGLGAEGLPIDEEIEQRIQRIAQASETWMYYYEIDKVVDEVINEVDKSRQDAKHGRI